MVPRAELVVLQTEGMLLALSMEKGGEITDINQIGTRRKRGFGKASPWEEEEAAE